MIPLDARLPDLLANRLCGTLPGRLAQSRLEPPATGGRHFIIPEDARAAAVMVLLYRDDDGQWRLPLTLRPTTLPDHAGQISLPGGLIESGESPYEAALRELEEELGVGAAGITPLGQLSPLYVAVSNFAVVPWVATIAVPPALTPNPAEVAEVLEPRLAHLLDPANVAAGQFESHGFTVEAPCFMWQGHRIWGATSMILAELVDVVVEAADQHGD
ncbi:MAG: CoA pyrophosphatase [Pirellulales bacterium]